MDGVAQIRVGPGATPLSEIPAAARAAGAPLVWLLDAAAAPRDGALAALLDVGGALAAGVPVDAGGEPRDTWIGTFADGDVEAVLTAAADHRVPLRFSPLYSLLAPRDLVLAESPPDDERYGPYADLEWTARMFRRSPGFLAARSEVTLPGRRLPVAPRPLRRLVECEGFRATDALRILRVAAARGR